MNKLSNVLTRIRILKNWYLFVPPLNRVYRFNVVARLRSGSKILLRDSHGVDFGLVMEIVGSNVYRLEEIKRPKVVADLGANIGIFSILVASRFPEAKVYAVEPDKENCERLRRNIELNRLTNVVVVEKAVSIEEGHATLYTSSNQSAYSLNFFPGARPQKVETIPLSFFDKVDALKVDIEGTEYEIMDPLPICQYIAIELHADPRREALLEKLASIYNLKQTDSKIFVGTRL